jgi:ABC-type glycerol-3-phosphate transport system substrate-binding protein
MRRSIVAMVLVAGLLVACGGQQTTSGAPAGTDGASTPVASGTPPPPATPAPTPTVKQLAAAYLKAVSAFNTATAKITAAGTKLPQGLTYQKRQAKAYAAADLVFIRAVEKIPWYGDYKALARRVLTYSNQVYVADRSAMTAKTWADLNYDAERSSKASEKSQAASNELRLALGLPPVPIK